MKTITKIATAKIGTLDFEIAISFDCDNVHVI